MTTTRLPARTAAFDEGSDGPLGVRTLPPRPTAPPTRYTAVPEPTRTPPERSARAVGDQQIRVGRLIRALAEVVEGHRPLTQLAQVLSPAVYDQLATQVEVVGSAGPPLPRRCARVRVASVHLSRPCDGALEVAARVDQGGRSRAVAMRLERRDEGRWRCTALTWG